jgi:hypothetical protein
MNKLKIPLTFALTAIVALSLYAEQKNEQSLTAVDAAISLHGESLVEQGRQIFRYDTFGDQDYWGGSLGLHQAIAGVKLGGVGPGVSPATALAVGLKVDQDALPPGLVQKIQAGQVNLNDPAVTLALLKLNAVVGLTGFFKRDGTLQSIGIQCALCHSTVDNAFAPGIGHRLDGWANRDLNVGAIVGLSPNLQPVADVLGVSVSTVQAVLGSWGPGKFDAELILDGKAFNSQQVSDGFVTGTNVSGATLLPSAFGLAGVNLQTYTGWGSVPYWNAFVANLEMHGKGTFSDARLDDAVKFPVAAATRNLFGHVQNQTDLISSKLAALQAYQLAIAAPAPPKGSFDAAAAARGEALFNGKAQCSTCHTDSTKTEPGWNMHTASEICIDDFQASRSPDDRYRTTPLNGLWTRTKGGFYHDGRFPALLDVVNHYDRCKSLGLSGAEKSDLVQFLGSLPNSGQEHDGEDRD